MVDSTQLYVLGGLAAALILASAAWSTLRKRLIVTETGFYDCDYLAQPRSDKAKIPGTVVICGGSVGGLLTARVCHDHFERVIIVEAESWLDSDDARKVQSWTQENTRSRIMQYTSMQGSQAFLHKAMSALYPNFDEECKASDIGVAPANFRPNFFGHVMKVPCSHNGGDLPKMLFASRQALETLTRRLTLTREYPNIQQIIGTVTGYTANDKHPDRLGKVSYRTREGATIDLDATFVIDCTGPTQAGAKWIQRAGFNGDDFNALRSSFDQKMHYVTFQFYISPELGAKLPIPGGFENIGGTIVLFFPDTSRDHRVLAAMKAEGRSIQLCCGSWGVDDLPRTLEGVKEHARSIKVEKQSTEWLFDLIDMLAEAEDTIKVFPIKVGPSYWTHYEKAKNLPSNWIAIGDSISRLNPLYGQGVSKAMLGALSLNTILHQNRTRAELPRNLVKQFFQSHAVKVAPLWQGTKYADYAQSTTIPSEGESLDDGKFLRWYTKQIQILASKDAYAGAVLWRSLCMLDVASIDLLHPRLVFKVFWQALTGY
ncbi:hypothetical protein BDZ89DRAFT_1058184 [Hymenopellis radicata]|nr:hypothetical protein BDZ89DRAFT_1058184 [Hymenopellis radicata]